MMATTRSNSDSASIFTSIYPWMIVFCGMMFYCFNYFLRVSPSMMQPELTQAFHISATQWGLLLGFYYTAYTPMQLVAGMIYDKFGARTVICSAFLIAICGLAVFTSAHNYAMACTGRLLIGLGCAFAYIGTLKLASIWLPLNRFATAAGLATAVGMISGALSQKYLTPIVESIGYQETLHGALIAGAMLCVLVVAFVRNRPQDQIGSGEMQAPLSIRKLLSALWIIFTNPQMWLIGTIGCLLYLPSSIFLDAWGLPYLKAVYGLTTSQATTITGCTFYGWIISGPLIGMFSDRIKRRCAPLTFTGFFAAALLCAVFYLPGIPASGLSLVFFMIGFCCGAHPLCFALGKESNPIQISATSVAVTNMLIMMGGNIFHPVVGMLLDWHTSSPLNEHGLHIYSSADYTFALSIVPIGVAIGIFLSLFLKETHCESQAKEEHERLFNPALATEK